MIDITNQMKIQRPYKKHSTILQLLVLGRPALEPELFGQKGALILNAPLVSGFLAQAKCNWPANTNYR